jgi:hypothetical protein
MAMKYSKNHPPQKSAFLTGGNFDACGQLVDPRKPTFASAVERQQGQAERRGGFTVALQRRQGEEPRLTLLDDPRLAALAEERRRLAVKMAELSDKFAKVKRP